MDTLLWIVVLQLGGVIYWLSKLTRVMEDIREQSRPNGKEKHKRPVYINPPQTEAERLRREAERLLYESQTGPTPYEELTRD